MGSAVAGKEYTEYWQVDPATWVDGAGVTGRALRQRAHPGYPPAAVPALVDHLLQRPVDYRPAAVARVAAVVANPDPGVAVVDSCRALGPVGPADMVTVLVRYYPVVVVDTVASADCRVVAEEPSPAADVPHGTDAYRAGPGRAVVHHHLDPAADRAAVVPGAPMGRSWPADNDDVARPDAVAAVDAIVAASSASA